MSLREELDQTSLGKLAQSLGETASDSNSFYQVITDKIGREQCRKKGKIISQAAEVGRRKFLEKLGWLFTYEKELHITAEILEVFDLAKKQFHQLGLHQESEQDWLELTEKFSDSSWVRSSKEKVTQYARY